MKAFVTGATGFVGSAVARALAARGHSLRVLTRPSSDRRNLAGLDAEVVAGVAWQQQAKSTPSETTS